MKKGSWDSKADYSDIVELFEQEDVADEDIARDMNMDLNTVINLRREFQGEEAMESPSLFFKHQGEKASRRKK